MEDSNYLSTRILKISVKGMINSFYCMSTNCVEKFQREQEHATKQIFLAVSLKSGCCWGVASKSEIACLRKIDQLNRPTFAARKGKGDGKLERKIRRALQRNIRGLLAILLLYLRNEVTALQRLAAGYDDSHSRLWDHVLHVETFSLFGILHM